MVKSTAAANMLSHLHSVLTHLLAQECILSQYRLESHKAKRKLRILICRCKEEPDEKTNVFLLHKSKV